MAELPVDVHLHAAREGHLCSLDGAHNPAWVPGRWAHAVGVQGLGTHAHWTVSSLSTTPSPQAPQDRPESSLGVQVMGCPLTGWTQSTVLAQRHSSGQPR